MLRLLALLALLLSFVGPAEAATYSWTCTDLGMSVTGATPTEACKKIADNYANTPPQSAVLNSCSKVTVTSYTCTGWWWNGFAWSGKTWTANRSGDSCAPGSTYNASTGLCDPGDPCAGGAGSFTSHEHRVGDLKGGARTEPPTTVCKNSCQYSFDYTVEKCYRFVDDSDKDGAYCSYRYKGSGTSCTAANPSPGSVFDQPPTKPPSDITPEYSSDNQCGEWVTTSDNTAVRNCTSSEKATVPGSMQCPSGGLMACTSGNPAPAHSDTSTTESQSKTTHADGSSTTTTETQTTETNCRGTKPCTSTGKTETTTSQTKPDGTPGDEATTCTGAGCDKPEEEPEEEEDVPREAAVGDCDGGFSCSGDAIDCAVLQQEREQTCHAQEQADFPGQKSAIEGLVQGDDFTLKETEIQAPSFINTATRFLPVGCPAPQTHHLSTGSGGNLVYRYEPFCRLASDLSWMIVAVASIWAAIYVGRAFGGE